MFIPLDSPPTKFRTRSRGLFYPSAGRKTAVWNTPDVPVYITDEVSNVRGTVEGMSDWVTPGFKKISSSGGIVNTWMYKNSSTRESSGNGPRYRNNISIVPNTQYYDCVGTHHGVDPLTTAGLPHDRPSSTIDLANLRALASTRARDSIQRPDYSGSVSLGELADTLSYLRNPVASGMTLAKAVQDRIARIGRADKGAGSNNAIAGALAGVNLSINFGFKPLLSEIQGILETLRDASFSRPERATARAKESREYTDTWTSIVENGVHRYQASWVYKETVTVRAGFLYQQSTSVSIPDHFGTRAKDLPKALWQVYPCSFIADWFANIASFIGAITPNGDTKILAAWTTTKILRTLTLTVSGYTPITSVPGWHTERDGSGTYSVEDFYFVRDNIVDPPSLAWKNLDWLKTDIGRTSSMYSVLAQRLSSIRTPMTGRGPQGKTPGAILPPDRWYG